MESRQLKRASFALLTSTTVLAVSLLLANRVVFSAATGSTSEVVSDETSEAPCRLAGQLTLASSEAVTGEPVTVTLTSSSGCARREIVVSHCWVGDFHLDPVSEQVEGVTSWVATTNLDDKRVAVIGGRGSPMLLQGLTSDRRLLRSAVGRLTVCPTCQTRGSDRCFEMARSELMDARQSGLMPNQASVLVATGYHNQDELAEVALAATALKAEGIRSFVVGATDYMSVLASSPSEFFSYAWRSAEATTRAALSAAEETTPVYLMASVHITATIPLGLEYVSGSAVPQAVWDPAARSLSWSSRPNAPENDESVAFAVRAPACGEWLVGDGSLTTATDNHGNVYRHQYTPQRLRVPCPTATSTSTSIPPSATATPTNTTTALPSATPTSEPEPLFLPIALREEACSRVRRVAVALVIDTSSSMQELTPSGRSKLEEARDAAGLFVDLLSFPADQGAIVSFDAQSRLAQTLTSSAADLHAGLASLVPGSGTNIAAGLKTAHEELTGPRRSPDNFSAMILLTDGRASVAPELVVPTANQAKADGVIIFTVGLGQQIDRDQLRAVASRPEWYFEAADAQDLDNVYRTIAVSIPCPAERYWGRR